MTAIAPGGGALRIALIGAGDIGILRAQALARTPACRLVVVADVNEARARAAAALVPGAAVESDWQRAVARPDVDAVVISTPPSLHLEMCLAAFGAGKDVLCEKPLARTPDECRAMVQEAERTGRTLATGFNYRFYPSFRLARDLLDRGVIGELDHIRSYGGYSATSHNQPWVHDAATVGGGALRDIGIHLIDLTRDFLGDVASVQGVATGRVWNYPGCEDNGFAILRNRQGNVATVHASWTEWRRYQFRVEIYGTRGCIRATCFPMMTQVVWAPETGGRTQSKTDWFPRWALGEKLRSYRWVVVESFVREFAAFAAAVQGRPSRIATGADGLRAVEIAFDAAGQSDPGPAAVPAGTGAVGAPPSNQPLRLSVVTLAFGGGLDDCLGALVPQASATGAEVVVPHDDSLRDAEALQARFPSVRFIRHSGVRTPAELRAAGAAAVAGDVLALLESHCRPAADWCQRILSAHGGMPHAAIGGPIEKGPLSDGGTDTALNWSVYLADYSRYMLPRPEGPADGLSDCNVSYKRSVLEALRGHWTTEFHENVVNGALRAAGGTLWFDPALAVFEQRSLTVGAALRDRFTFGRLFGSSRAAGAGWLKRLAMAVAALFMPPLLVARVAGNVRGRGRHGDQLVRCLPALAMISAAWLAGESVGYLTGRAGRSLAPRASRPVRATA